MFFGCYSGEFKIYNFNNVRLWSNDKTKLTLIKKKKINLVIRTKVKSKSKSLKHKVTQKNTNINRRYWLGWSTLVPKLAMTRVTMVLSFGQRSRKVNNLLIAIDSTYIDEKNNIFRWSILKMKILVFRWRRRWWIFNFFLESTPSCVCWARS